MSSVDELFQLYALRSVVFSQNVIRVDKSSKMGWAGHVARMGDRRDACRFWWET
jgi:hypothetical protein